MNELTHLLDRLLEFSMPHLVAVPILVPMFTAALMLLLGEHHRRLKSALSVISGLIGLLAALALLRWVNAPDTARIRKLEIVELLRNKYGVKGALSDFLVEDDQCSVSFKGPGYSADAFIKRKDGTFELTEVRLGLVAVLNDLHKGRDSGSGWSWLIDVSAGFLVIVSLSGLAMLFFLKNKRVKGILVAVVGAALCYLVYGIWVP